MTLLAMTCACLAIGSPWAPVKEPDPKLLKHLLELPAKALKEAKKDTELIDRLFQGVLKRPATRPEQLRVLKFLQSEKNRTKAGREVVWALVNTKEFGTKHQMERADVVALSLRLEEAWFTEKLTRLMAVPAVAP
jgi:hypothetical protein